MKLPKVGTSVEDLKCQKCGMPMKEIRAEDGTINCPEVECPQKVSGG